MKAAIVSNGDIKDYSYIGSIIKDCDIIVCADGGANHVMNCGISPDVLVGDLDSISKDVLEKLESKGTKTIKYPRDKDYTDTLLAVNYAIESGADEVILLGSTGDRLDHTLANIFMLLKLVKQNIKCCILNEKNTIYITDKEISLKGSIGDIVSLLPVGGDVTGIYTEGLQYRLCGSAITMGDPLGISNILISEEVKIKIDSGFLLVIKSRD